MQVWRNVSSFRQRARNAEQISQQLKEEVKQKLVKRTYDSMSSFEDHVKALKEKAAREEAEEEAELIRLSEGWARARAVQFERLLIADANSDASSVKSASGSFPRWRSDSVLPAHVRLDNSEVLHAQRPPSPLHVHDYGHISVRPRSYQQQLRNKHGGPSRPNYRQEFCGVYFPGPECKQGPYGMSMAEPILMPPRCWVKGKSPPDRHPRDTADMRPRTAEGRDRPTKNGKADVILQQRVKRSTVPTTNAHRCQNLHRARCARKRDQEAFIESVRFEQGHFEGRFADPMLKNSGLPNEDMIRETHMIGADVDEPPEDDVPRVAWDLKAGEAHSDMAARIFLGLYKAMRERHARLLHLFKPVNRGVKGILEPAEFLEGLQRLHIVEEGHISVQQIVDVMYDLDPDFDGRIALSLVRKCIAATRALYMPSISGPQHDATSRPEPADIYGDKVPVEKVVVERQPKSLGDFERSYDQFRRQQHELLVLYNERDPKVAPTAA